MGVVRVKRPTTHKGRKAIENKEPKIIENTKQTLFIKGKKTGDVVNGVLKDILSLKKPDAMMLSKKHDILPFEDASLIEKHARKFDSSFFFFGSHTKKRPNNVVIGRTFDHTVLDMAEFGIDAYEGLSAFPSEKVMTGIKPVLSFVGTAFDQDPKWKRVKSLLVDAFYREEVNSVRLQGLEHQLCFIQDEDQLFVRSFKIQFKKSGSRTPRVELEEIGPRIDLCLRRTKFASDDLFKTACKQPKELRTKTVKNIKRDVFGSKLGRVHIKQGDVSKLQTRKMKGLRRTPKERRMERAMRDKQKQAD